MSTACLSGLWDRPWGNELMEPDMSDTKQGDSASDTDAARDAEDRIYEAAIRQVVWAPQLDITAHELALCQPVLAKLLGRTTRDGLMYMHARMPPEYEKLPPEAQRHFQVEDV